MSSNCELEYIHVKNLGWFYIQENPATPRNCHFYDYDPFVGGPYPSIEGAAQGASRHGNAGGSTTFAITIEEVIASKDGLRQCIERALGKPLEMPPLPEDPVDVTSALLMGGTVSWGSGPALDIIHSEAGGAVAAKLPSLSAKNALGFVQIEALRDEASITVAAAVYGDAVSNEDVAHILKHMAKRAADVYPGEAFFGSIALRRPLPAVETVYHVTGKDAVGEGWGVDDGSILRKGLRAGTCFCTDALVDYYAETITDEGREPVVIALPLYKAIAARAEPDHGTIAEPITIPLGKSEEELHAEYATRDGSAIDCLEVFGALRCTDSVFVWKGMIEDHQPQAEIGCTP